MQTLQSAHILKALVLVIFLQFWLEGCSAIFSDRHEEAIVLKYLFTNKECQGDLVNDVSTNADMGPLSLGAGSSCPSYNDYANGKNGVNIKLSADPGEFPNAIKSSGNAAALRNRINAAAAPAQELTFEVWFELTSVPPNGDTTTIFEFGPGNPDAPSLGNGESLYGLKLSYIPKAGVNELKFEVSAKLLTNTVVMGPNFNGQSTFTATSSRFELETGKIYHLVAVLFPNVLDDDNDDLNIYLNWKGQTFSSTNITTTGQTGDLPIGQLLFHDSLLLRIGTSYGSFPKTTFPATFYFVGIHTEALTVGQIQQNFNAGLPNSIPAAINSNNTVFEDSDSALSIDDDAFHVDFDGNDVRAVLTSLPDPAYAHLVYDGNIVTAGNLNTLVITDFSQLKFRSNRQNEFDITTGVCTADKSKTQNRFKYKLTDTVCTPSADPLCLSNEVTAIVCVKEVNDPPIPTNKTGSEAKIGSYVFIDLEGVDPDAQSIPQGTYTLTLPTPGWIKFTDSVGIHGNLFLEANCNSPSPTPLPINTLLQLQGNGKYRVCYKATIVNATEDVVGIDQFPFKLFDSEGLESTVTGYFDVTVLNPLSPCNQYFPYGSNGARHICANVGDEEEWIPIFLNAKDEIGSRTLEYEITKLPSNGALCFVNDETNPSGCHGSKLPIKVGDKVKAADNKPNLYYRGNKNYFNEIPVDVFPEIPSPWKTLGDDVVGGCTTQYSVCSNGKCCPDKIGFRATVGEAKSPEGTYLVFVKNERDTGYDVTAPDEIFVESKAFRFSSEADSKTISIVDVDGDSDVIGISIIPTQGQMRLTPPLLDGAPHPKFEINGESCKLQLETGCNILTVSSHLSMLNTALQTLEYVPPGEKINPKTDVITIRLFKPYDGSFSGQGQLSKTIKIKPLDTSPSTVDDGLGPAIIAGLSAVGFVVFVAVAWSFIWFCRKSHKISKDAVRTVRSMRSSSKPGVGGVGEDGIVVVKADVDESKTATPSKSKSSSKSKSKANVTSVTSSDSNADASKSTSSKSEIKKESSSNAVAAAGGAAAISKSKSKASTITTGTAENEKSTKAIVIGGKKELGSPTGGKREEENTTADGADMEVVDDSIFDWEKHIDKKTGDVYFFNPKTGVSQWDPPTVKARRTKK